MSFRAIPSKLRPVIDDTDEAVAVPVRLDEACAEDAVAES